MDQRSACLRSSIQRCINFFLSFSKLTLNHLYISRRKNKNGSEYSWTNIINHSKGLDIKSQMKAQFYIHTFPLCSIFFVLRNFKGLKLAWNNFKPRSSPSSKGFWISLYHLDTTRYWITRKYQFLLKKKKSDKGKNCTWYWLSKHLVC